MSRNWKPGHAKQRDANERAILDYALAHGYSVVRIDVPCDALLGKGRTTHLVEIKREVGPRGGVAGRKLTKPQQEFFDTWRGCYHLARTGPELVAQLQQCVSKAAIVHG
jgi:hypothetical protein